MSIKSLNIYNVCFPLFKSRNVAKCSFYINWILWVSKKNRNAIFFHQLVFHFWKIYCTIKVLYSELLTVTSFWMSVFVSQLRKRTITEANRKYNTNSTFAVLAICQSRCINVFGEGPHHCMLYIFTNYKCLWPDS